MTEKRKDGRPTLNPEDLSAAQLGRAEQIRDTEARELDSQRDERQRQERTERTFRDRLFDLYEGSPSTTADEAAKKIGCSPSMAARTKTQWNNAKKADSLSHMRPEEATLVVEFIRELGDGDIGVARQKFEDVVAWLIYVRELSGSLSGD